MNYVHYAIALFYESVSFFECQSGARFIDRNLAEFLMRDKKFVSCFSCADIDRNPIPTLFERSSEKFRLVNRGNQSQRSQSQRKRKIPFHVVELRRPGFTPRLYFDATMMLRRGGWLRSG